MRRLRRASCQAPAITAMIATAASVGRPAVFAIRLATSNPVFGTPTDEELELPDELPPLLEAAVVVPLVVAATLVPMALVAVTSMS